MTRKTYWCDPTADAEYKAVNITVARTSYGGTRVLFDHAGRYTTTSLGRNGVYNTWGIAAWPTSSSTELFGITGQGVFAVGSIEIPNEAYAAFIHAEAVRLGLSVAHGEAN